MSLIRVIRLLSLPKPLTLLIKTSLHRRTWGGGAYDRWRVTNQGVGEGKRLRTPGLKGHHARVSAGHENQEANRAATASHGELPRLPSKEGRDQQKAEGVEKGKHERRKDPYVPRDWNTRTHLKMVSP
ncbi:hypothetical protein AVEN_194644-1 [Araneus ventricosus]|uniref:Uncharacterized protein n=1 Tax=Araneus ventricosus TaxID=182803 RepID=A0A4Y2A6S5_ARAVE|nr:hypothetical protein AVEN_194644-1 [Araneus ventricosus]